MSQRLHIRCPKCNWEPDDSCRWICSVCKTKWNTFETQGCCPGCGEIYKDTMCIGSKGGCKQMSPHQEWYEYNVAPKFNLRSLLFWKKATGLPVTDTDKVWIETSLVYIAELFDPVYFRSLNTITPDNPYFDHKFTGIEKDAEFILERLTSIMQIDAWEIKLMFYSNSPTRFVEGITATEQPKLKDSWPSSSGKYVDNGFGHKEVWIELEVLKDPISLIATMAHELSHYKLLGENRIEKNDEFLTELTSIAFGFGIFQGNSYFKFAQWTGTTHQGWRMQKNGYLLEQVIAYAMAWLANYRNEDIAWSSHLNKAIRTYFDQCYEYISQNKEKIIWEI